MRIRRGGRGSWRKGAAFVGLRADGPEYWARPVVQLCLGAALS